MHACVHVCVCVCVFVCVTDPDWEKERERGRYIDTEGIQTDREIGLITDVKLKH